MILTAQFDAGKIPSRDHLAAHCAPSTERDVALVRNAARYLSAVVAEYRAECATGFPNDYEARRKLWHCAVVVCEVAEDPELWLEQLRELSLGHIRPTHIETTIRSAERKALRP